MSGVSDYGIDLNPPVLPESEDCSDAVVPVEPAGDTGKRRVLVSELVSVTRVFFRRYKLALYSYLNRCLRNGTLAKYAGSTIRNSKITHEICSFPRVTYWRIDRENLLCRLRKGLQGWHGRFGLYLYAFRYREGFGWRPECCDRQCESGDAFNVHRVVSSGKYIQQRPHVLAVRRYSGRWFNGHGRQSHRRGCAVLQLADGNGHAE